MLRLILTVCLFILYSSHGFADPVHGIAIQGEPALGPDFRHFPYANPSARKGGHISIGVVGTFNNLNSFIIRGKPTTARGMWDPELGNLVIESLMMRSRDEPFTMYGLLAETVEWGPGHSSLQFNLNPKARWSDGKPVTADDVIFSFELLRDKGRPPFSTRLKQVEKMEKVSERSVKFTFKPGLEREFPLLLGLSPVLPKHAISVDTFEQTTLKPPLGSGPYLIKTIQPGEKIVYQRDPNYWAKDLPAKVGLENFDEISIEYFSQENTLFEAFKKGEIDIFQDGSPLHWIRDYDFPAVSDGRVIKDEFEPGLPANMLGLVFNTRREKFADIRVRKALTLAFDFQWLNRVIYEKAYTRTESFWQNSELSSLGRPADARELAILGAAKSKVEPDILAGKYRLPVTDGTGRDRKILRKTFDLLTEAGYHIENGRMIGPNGNPLAFEILTQNKGQELIGLAYQRSLAVLGIAVSIRTVEDAQYQERSQKFNYDMIIRTYAASLSPGIEQGTRWGSAARDRNGSENLAGAADPEIDRVIDLMQKADTKEDFTAAVRALDRILLSQYYLVPLYHSGQQRIARWKHIGRPGYLPLYGAQIPAWWDERVQ